MIAKLGKKWGFGWIEIGNESFYPRTKLNVPDVSSKLPNFRFPFLLRPSHPTGTVITRLCSNSRPHVTEIGMRMKNVVKLKQL